MKQICRQQTIVLAVVLMLWSHAASAQREKGTFTVYPRMGLNLSRMAGDKVITEVEGSGYELKAKNKVGLTAGAELMWQFGSGAALSVGALYADMGTSFKNYIHYLDKEGTDYDEMLDLHMNLRYLQVPLMLHLWIADGLSVGAGLECSRLLNARSTTEWGIHRTVNDVKTYEEEKSSGSVTPLFKKFEMAIPVGIAYEYQNYSLSLRYHFGLTRTYRELYSPKNRGFELTLGYALDL